jgi:predicted NBD/HSP70 family sugar kinase
MAHRATVKDLRRRNRASVLRTLVLAKQTTRAEVAAACELSTATVTNVVADLLAEGLVHEVGLIPSDGGRPIAQLAIRPDGGYVIGATVSEQGVLVELFDLSLAVVDRINTRLRPSNSKVTKVGKALADAVADLRAKHPEAEDTLLGLGLAMPGLVERSPNGDVTLYADQLGWPATALREFCSIDDLPVQADNGANTLTMAEQWFGSVRDVDDAIVALLGRGVGAGIISGGRLLRGVSNGAGEWGHTTVAVGGRECSCGDRGCLEAYVGSGGISARWAEAKHPTSRDVDNRIGSLVKLADEGDPTAVSVLDETIEFLGVGLANLVNIANPERIIVGGWDGLTLFDARGKQLAEAVTRHALPRPASRVTVEKSSLGRDAVSLGAALLTLEQFIEGTLPARVRS